MVHLKIRPIGIILDGSDAILGNVPKDQLNSFAALLGSGIGNPHSDQRHCRAFFQHSRWLAKPIVFDFTAGRIGSGLVNLRALQRQRIRDGHVTGNVGKDDWVLGRDGIELLAIREPLLRPKCVVPAAAGNPFAFLVLRDRSGDPLLHFLNGRHARQRDGELVRGGATQMHVRIIEAGHYKLTIELDRFRTFLAAAAIEKDVGHLANAGDLPFANSDSLGPRLRRIVCINAPVNVIDQMRSPLRDARIRLECQNEDNNREREDPSEEKNAIPAQLHRDFSSATPETPRTVRRARFSPASRPVASYHS